VAYLTIMQPSLSKDIESHLCLDAAALGAVEQVQARLHDLINRRMRLLERIWGLRRLVDGISILGRPDPTGTSPPLRPHSPGNSMPADRAAECSDLHLLRRACRIALLEAQDPETAMQILQRIEIRGSFIFPEGADRLSLVVAGLMRICERGEALHGTGSGVRKWCYKRDDER
jgi:hypothetical protein